jgi:hypothetical protein
MIFGTILAKIKLSGGISVVHGLPRTNLGCAAPVDGPKLRDLLLMTHDHRQTELKSARMLGCNLGQAAGYLAPIGPISADSDAPWTIPNTSNRRLAGAGDR